MTDEDLPPNDPTIADDVALWRRVPPQWVVFDHNEGRVRPSSQAFQNQKGWDAFSVSISCDAEALGAEPEALLAGHSGYGVASFEAGSARELRQGIVRVPEEGEIAHGHVVGRKSKSCRKQLASCSDWLVEPG